MEIIGVQQITTLVELPERIRWLQQPQGDLDLSTNLREEAYQLPFILLTEHATIKACVRIYDWIVWLPDELFARKGYDMSSPRVTLVNRNVNVASNEKQEPVGVKQRLNAVKVRVSGAEFLKIKVLQTQAQTQTICLSELLVMMITVSCTFMNTYCNDDLPEEKEDHVWD